MSPAGTWVPGNRWDLAPEATRVPSVTVVVTHYEQPRELARTLAALRGQTHPAHLLQVVVADDGSAEPPEVPPGVEVVAQPDEGFRAGRIRNAAAARARGDVLLFLDADTTPEPGYVAALAHLPGVLPEAVVVGRRRHADLIDLPPGGDLAAVGRSHELAEPSWLREAYRRTKDLLVADETSFRFIISACLGCSRWLFEETGGFDESYVGYGGEDWEWAHRAWNQGAVLAHVSSAVAWHDGPAREDRVGWGDDATGRERLLHETVAIASRVPVPGVAPRALLGSAGDPLVTVAVDLDGDALVLCIDSLLAAWPQARVLLDPRRARLMMGDPRIVAGAVGAAQEHPAGRSSWRHLHLAGAVTGAVESWVVGADLLAGPDALDEVLVRGVAGEVVASWSTLRHERRAARWRDLPPPRGSTVAADLRPVPASTTAQARWGGWA